MPNNRAGKIVRCPECKSVIRLGVPTASELNSGKPVPMHAELVSAPQVETGVEEVDTFPSIDATAGDTPPREAKLPASKTSTRESGSSEKNKPLAVPKPPETDSAPSTLVARDRAFEAIESAAVVEEPAVQKAAEKRSETRKRKARTQRSTSKQVERKPDAPQPTGQSSDEPSPDARRNPEKTKRADRKPRPKQAYSQSSSKSPQSRNRLPIPAPSRDQAPDETALKEKALNEKSPTEKAPPRHRVKPVTDGKDSRAAASNGSTHSVAAKLSSLANSPEKQVSSESASENGAIGFAPVVEAAPAPEFVRIDTDIASEVAQEFTPETIRARAEKSNSDRVILTRFIAGCICVLGLLNLIPAVFHWTAWAQTEEAGALPRWIYIQLFVAAMHMVYTIYLVQIPDWSALRAVSFAMLAFAVVFGAVSTGLLIGGAHGTVARGLEVATVLRGPAGIWCVIMLILSTLVSYMSGREAGSWRRADLLIAEIFDSGNHGRTDTAETN